MQLEEFKYIYDDLKLQLKQQPSLKLLLKLTEKSTRKLECQNLYNLSEKKEFDLEIQEERIIKEVKELYANIGNCQNKKTNIEQISKTIQQIKQRNMDMFDLLARQQQILTQQIELAQYFIQEQDHDNQIKEVDEEQQPKFDQVSRIDQLNKELQEIHNKIAKSNNGRGKWLQTDHKDFIRIYNKFRGNDKKIVEEGVTQLGMTSAQIIDHLQVYDNYLQLQREKKIIAYEYKQIKDLERQQQLQKQIQKKKKQQQSKKLHEIKLKQENALKKMKIKQFREKKIKEKQALLQQAEEKEKKVMKPSIPLPPEKKKQIMEKNKLFIRKQQQNFKKRQASLNKGGRIGSKEKINTSNKSINK